MKIALGVLIFAGLAVGQTWSISTFAGGGLPVNVAATSSSLAGPQAAMAVDTVGNLYFADGNTVLRLDISTGMLSLVAGNGTAGYSGDGGLATAAQLNDPRGVAVDAAGNVYVASFADHVIRKVSGGVISTIAGNGSAGYSGDGGLATGAALNGPYGIAVDTSGNVFIADSGNSRVREISGGVISTVAGTGLPGFSGDGAAATSAQLLAPDSVAVDGAGNLFIGDYFGNRIRKVSGGSISTVAGTGLAGFSGDGGAASSAQVNTPFGVAVDAAGNLYIADYFNNRIRAVSGGVISTVAGSGAGGFGGDKGLASKAQIRGPLAIAVDGAGNVYFADSGNNRIRRIAGGLIDTVAGNGSAGFSGDGGTAAGAQLNRPSGLALDAAGALYISDMRNNRVRKVTSGTISSAAGNGSAGFSGDGAAASLAQLSQPAGVALDASGNIFIADSGNNRIRRVTSGAINTFANGLGGPMGVALDSSGNVYVADAGNNLVRKVSGNAVSTVAGTGIPGFSGDGGPALSAQLSSPGAVALDSSGNLYIADTGNNRVRRISNGMISTIAGLGPAGFGGDGGAPLSAQLSGPAGISVNAAGAILIADTGNDRVRRIAGGTISTIAGGGRSLGDGGLATAATLSAPQGLTSDSVGNIYVADSGNNRIRMLSPVALAVSGPPSLPGGVVGAAYTGASMTATGGAGGYSWTATGLPKGLTLSAGGALAGTPTAAGNSSAHFTVKDSANASASVTLSLAVTLPVPTIVSTSPSSAVAYSGALKLTITGTGFVSPATVQFDGNSLSATVSNSTTITVQIPASLIGGAGTSSITVTAGGGTSVACSFTITPQPPAIAGLSPSSAVATGTAFTLTVNGTGFTQASQVNWNGSALLTTFVNANQLTAYITSSLIASAGNATVTVTDGAATSGSSKLTINAAPTVTSLNPSAVVAGGAGFTLTVTGTGFASGAQVQWNGNPLVTTFGTATQLTAAVTASMVASVASVTVQVNLGGASSNGVTLTVNGPPSISSLSPASAAVGGALTLTVNGSGFVSSSVVQWNGTPLKTTFVNASQLTAAVTATQTAIGGSFGVTVANTGATTSAVTFTVVPPSISAGGVVPIYSAAPVIQSGSWVSIYGTGLATSTAVWTGNFPTTLGGVTVTINNKKAYLWAVTPTQINLQAPDDTTTGSVNVAVTSGGKTLTSTVTLAQYGPSLSLFPGSSYASCVILTSNKRGAYGGGTYDLAAPVGKFSFATRPVKVGETIELFGVGFGPTNPSVAAGKAFSGAAPTANPVSITIGGVAAQVLFAGITGAGMYQFNVVVPNVSSGDQALIATVSGNSTPAGVMLTIQ